MSVVSSVVVFRAWPLSCRDEVVSCKTLVTMLHLLSGKGQHIVCLQQGWPRRLQSRRMCSSAQLNRNNTACGFFLLTGKPHVQGSVWCHRLACYSTYIYFTLICIMFCLSQLDIMIDRGLTGQWWHGYLHKPALLQKYGNLICYGDTLIMPFRRFGMCCWRWMGFHYHNLHSCQNGHIDESHDTYLGPFCSAARLWLPGEAENLCLIHGQGLLEDVLTVMHRLHARESCNWSQMKSFCR